MIARATLPAWLRRPVVLALFSLVALAALLSGGLVVAHAVDGTPSADASPASSGGNGDSNAAVGVNTKDGKTVYAMRLKIVQVTSNSVDAANAAVAVNSGCTDCSTVAVAFEGVIVVGSPSDFQPTNLALAMNVDCSGCTAFADAYQQVVQTSTRVRVTKAGRKQIASIRKDLNALKHSDLTLDQIRARVAADEQAFAEVLRTQLTPVGHVKDPAPADAPDVSDNADAPPADQGASQSPSPPAEGASPSADTSSTPDASPPAESGSPSTDPTPTASPTP